MWFRINTYFIRKVILSNNSVRIFTILCTNAKCVISSRRIHQKLIIYYMFIIREYNSILNLFIILSVEVFKSFYKFALLGQRNLITCRKDRRNRSMSIKLFLLDCVTIFFYYELTLTQTTFPVLNECIWKNRLLFINSCMCISQAWRTKDIIYIILTITTSIRQNNLSRIKVTQPNIPIIQYFNERSHV